MKPISRSRLIAVVLASVAMKPIATLMINGPTSRKLKYSLNRRAKLLGRSTRQTKLKLLSTFCAIDNAVNSKITMAMLASAEPLTLSTKLDHSARELAGARAERGKKAPQHRLEIAMQAQTLQHREREREQRHDREHRRVDEAHRAQGQVAVREIAQQGVRVPRGDEPPRRRIGAALALRPEAALDRPSHELH